MDDFEIKVEGTPVVYSNMPPEPYNPLNRPEIHYKKPIIAALLYLITTVTLAIVGAIYFSGYAVWVCLGWSLLYFALIAKRTLIWMVHLYQNKAPDEVRLKCIFEPSCSEYMIMAVNKYGFIKGTYKGIKRLGRCHPPNGGKDYP